MLDQLGLHTCEDEDVVMEMLKMPISSLSETQIRMLDDWVAPRLRAVQDSYSRHPFSARDRYGVLGWVQSGKK